MIIALSGLPRVGKDTFADSITKTFNNVVSYSFAYPFKKALCDLFDWTYESFELDNKEDIDHRWGISKREAMEYIGTEIFRKDIRKRFPEFDKKIGDKIWIKRFEQFCSVNNNIIVSDLRHLSEYEYLKSVNAKLIKITRPNYPLLNTKKSYDINSMEFDYVIENSIEGNPSEFETKAIELYKNIKEYI